MWWGFSILAAITTVLVPAVPLGVRRRGNRSAYFYEIGDAGHPGVVNAVSSMGFIVGAAICTTVAVAVAVPRQTTWLLAALLLATLGVDDLLRLHNSLPAGDIISRIIYWGAAAVLVVRLRPTVRRLPGAPMVVVGLAFLITSELLDFLRPEASVSRYDTMSILEEAAACLGAWSLVVACIGLVPPLLQREVTRRRSMVAGAPADVESTGAA